MPGMKWGQKMVLTEQTGSPGEGGLLTATAFSLCSPSKAAIETAVTPKRESFLEEQNQVMLPWKNSSECSLWTHQS